MCQQKRLYQYRFLSRIVIEAKTPLSVGSGEKDIIADQLIIRDVNGLPFIPGTAIAGILRHAMDESTAKKIFGFQETKKERDQRKEEHKESDFQENIDEGSQIIFSSAHLVINKEGKAVEGLLSHFLDSELEQGNEKDVNKIIEYLKNFENLPVRQHVRINEKGTSGTSAFRGKFNEEVVFKGTRFCFEVEMLSETDDKKKLFKEVMSQLASSTIQVGSGTRSGHGEIEIIPSLCQFAYLNLKDKKQRNAYIDKTSSLNDPFWSDPQFVDNEPLSTQDAGWTTYRLDLQPEDFFLFGSGFGNENADMTSVSEAIVDWSDEGAIPKLSEKDDNILIPGSSVKGAISHRVAYHYNRIKTFFIGDQRAKVGNDNEAVRTLFGYTLQNEKEANRGNILISDVIQKVNLEQTKTLNHVSIDRFTGGAIAGALFSEEVIYGNEVTYTLTLKVKNESLIDNEIKQALEETLLDITEGLLPLGGGTNRGHGSFTGKIIKNCTKEIKRNGQSK